MLTNEQWAGGNYQTQTNSLYSLSNMLTNEQWAGGNYQTQINKPIFDRFWENRPKRGKQFFSVSPGKALWVVFFRNFFMVEMDRHQLGLAYDAVVSSGVL